MQALAGLLALSHVSFKLHLDLPKPSLGPAATFNRSSCLYFRPQHCSNNTLTTTFICFHTAARIPRYRYTQHTSYTTFANMNKYAVAHPDLLTTANPVASQDQFATVLRAIQDLQERFDARDRRFDDLEQRLDARDKRFDTLEQRFIERFDSQEKRFDNLEGRLDTHDQRFDSLEKHFDAHDKRFDGLEKRFDAHDKRFDSLDKRFDGQEKRFDSLISLERSGTAHTESLALQLTRLDKRIPHRQEHFNKLERRIGKLDEHFNKLNESVQALGASEITSLAGF